MFVQKRRWTHEDETFLSNNWGTRTDKELAGILGRSTKSIRRKREEMELRKVGWRGYCAPNPTLNSVKPNGD